MNAPLPSSSEGETETCCHNMASKTRNLVICIDSGLNRYADMNTNIVELYNLVSNIDDVTQLTWYDSGNGTYISRSSGYKSIGRALGQNFDTAISWRFAETVQAAYHWLCDNYEGGDRILCFGFGRGALQVRVLSAMIAKVGLISKGNERQIQFAYELYHTVGSGSIGMAEHFKMTFSRRDVKVHFVGAWDTVSQAGFAGVDIMSSFPGVAEGMKHVCYFRHALALDECRVIFLPLYANRVNVDMKNMRDHDSKKTSGSIPNSLVSRPHTLEVWFAGTHADIGGLNIAGRRSAFYWMIYEAGGFGLHTKEMVQQLHCDEAVIHRNSVRGLWWLFELIPWRLWTETTGRGKKRSMHKPHLGRSRTIEDGQKLHSSVLQALNKGDYHPKARLPFHDSNPNDSGGIDEWVASDAHELLKPLINKFVLENDYASWDAVVRYAISEIGRQAVYDEVMRYITAEDDQYAVDDKSRSKLIRRARELLKDHRMQLRMHDEIKAKQHVLHDEPIRMYEKQERRFLDEFTTYQRLVLKGHLSPVRYVSFSQDAMKIVSVSENGTLLQWDASTGEKIMVETLVASENASVKCVTISPDAIYIASASTDKTVTILKNASISLQKMYHHYDQHFVFTMSFSADGNRLVSGSDGSLRIWEMQGEKPMIQCMEGQGHTKSVLSLSFSPDGMSIVSGSEDKTICIWNVDSRTQLNSPWEGHENSVNSVAFSPDGSRVVSGSADCTIRIWDVATGRQAGQPLVGHENTIYSVSFSPDGRRIASGSADRTVRIWNVATGKQIGEPLRGHRRDVNCVCFSPDGLRVVSGSSDWTLRVWDITVK